jgi:seryl-tRNA synthetase
MLDIRLIRETPDFVRSNISRRNDPEKLKLLEELISADTKWRKLETDLNKMRQKRNEINIEIIGMKKQGKPIVKLLKDADKIAQDIKKFEAQSEKYQAKVRSLLFTIPNIIHDSVPMGKDEKDNVEIRRWGSAPQFDFKPNDHMSILQNLGLVDAERGAKVAGHGFMFLRNDLVLLDFALQRFAIDFLRKKGFNIIEPPLMVNKESYEGVAPLQDFTEMMYKIHDYDLFLIATSEHSIGTMLKDEIVNKDELPLKFAGISPCFRKELGAHGKYTRGLFRMHQFNKIEQFVFSHPDDSWNLFEDIQKNSEEMYQELGLHHRVIEMCTGDLGIMKARSFDIEVWMADGQFRECGSNSNLTDYSARNLNIRFREGPGKPVAGFVHTLNNTALATSRTMIAIIEQFQQKDGSVVIPGALRPYMNGIDRLEKK